VEDTLYDLYSLQVFPACLAREGKEEDLTYTPILFVCCIAATTPRGTNLEVAHLLLLLGAAIEQEEHRGTGGGSCGRGGGDEALGGTVAGE